MPRIPFPALALVASTSLLAALPVPAGAAATPSAAFTVVSGETRLRGDEQVCFRISDDRFLSDRLVVRIRFGDRIPRGRLSLDGTRSEPFSRLSEEIAFVVDPRGTHRLKLEMDGDVTVTQLTVTSTESTIVRESCATYDFEQERRVNLEGPRSEPTNAFETPEERAERERRSSSAPPRPQAPPAPAPAPMPASGTLAGIVPSGSEMSLTLQNPIDTRTSYAGQLFTTYVSHDVVQDGRVLLPSGTRVEGRVIESKDAGRFGRSSLKLGFERVYMPDGQSVPMQANLERLGKGSAGKQGGIIAGSAIGGAILGKVLGGDDKDALLGALLGGGIAAGAIAGKENEPIVLPAGTVLAVRTEGNIAIPASQPPRTR